MQVDIIENLQFLLLVMFVFKKYKIELQMLFTIHMKYQAIHGNLSLFSLMFHK